MKLIQASDLHLSASNETGYGFSILEEILQKGTECQATGILFCGDIFDTFADLEALRTRFLNSIKIFPGKIFFLPGNHESLRRQGSGQGFQMFDWGNQISLLETFPFSILSINDEVEILGIPHQASYGGLLGILPPPKKAKVRIGMAHATVAGMSFTGLGEEAEEDGGIIDISQIQALNCDYVAVGHIHSARAQTYSNCEVAYAGSSRVWRKGEMGSRGGYLLEIEDGKVKKTKLIWDRAGEYRDVLIQLGLDGNPEKTAVEYFGNFSRHDWVRIRWSGIVENMSGMSSFKKILEDEWKPKLRLMDFSEDESDVKVVANLSEDSYFQRFIEIMNSKKKLMDEDAWIRTKKLGLELLLEGKK